jgi:hypothetical protein
MTAALEAIVPLNEKHDVSAFDCGEPPLSDFLRKFALANQEIALAEPM